MAITQSGLTVHTQTGGGTWLDVGGGGGSASNTDVFVSSTGSRGRKVSNAVRGFLYQVNASGTDLSNSVIIIRWATLAGVSSIATRASGGVVMEIRDTSGNRSVWNLDGNDTYGGGWKVSVCDTSNAPTSNPGGTAATLTAVEYVGIVWNITANVGGGDDNCFIDEILSCPNTGITATGNTTALIADLQTWDDASDYGLFETRSGVTFFKGGILNLAPDASAIASTDETLIFENPSYYDGTNVDSALTDVGLVCADADPLDFIRANFIADDNSGEITGSDATRRFDFGTTVTDVDLDTCVIRGFDNEVAIIGSNSSVDGCTFDGCAKVTTGAAVVTNCFFRNAIDAGGAYFWDESSDMSDCTFVSDGTGYGIHYRPTGAGPFTDTFDNITFTGYGSDETANAAVHINPVTTTVTITINVTNGSTPTVDEDAGYTGTFTISQSVTVTITVKDVSGTAIQNAQTGVFATNDGEEIINADTNASGIATTSYSGVNPREVKVWIRKASSGATRYRNFSSIQNIGANGLTLDVTMTEDPNNNATS